MPAIIPRLLLSLLLVALPALPANKTGNLTNTRSLAFGKFVAAGGGTITVSPAGARSKTGAVALISGGTISSASYTLTESGAGKSLSWTTITLPATATLTNGSATMQLSNFVSDPPNTFLGTGRTIMTVGATLTVAPNQAVGNYSGSFSVTVNYQ
jgi:hypothetical protein